MSSGRTSENSRSRRSHAVRPPRADERAPVRFSFSSIRAGSTSSSCSGRSAGTIRGRELGLQLVAGGRLACDLRVQEQEVRAQAGQRDQRDHGQDQLGRFRTAFGALARIILGQQVERPHERDLRQGGCRLFGSAARLFASPRLPVRLRLLGALGALALREKLRSRFRKLPSRFSVVGSSGPSSSASGLAFLPLRLKRSESLISFFQSAISSPFRVRWGSRAQRSSRP